MSPIPRRVNLDAADVAMRRLIFRVNRRGEGFDRGEVESREHLGLARLLVHPLEVDFVGGEGRADDGDAQEHVEQAERLDGLIHQPRGDRGGEEAGGSPEVVVVPEAAERGRAA